MNRRPVHEIWLTFKRQCVPPGAGFTQRTVMRDSFYAGAVALFRAMQAGVSDDADPTESDLALMAAIEADLMSYPDRRQQEEP